MMWCLCLLPPTLPLPDGNMSAAAGEGAQALRSPESRPGRQDFHLLTETNIQDCVTSR